MENAAYVGLSYQVALERKMNIIANNVANMDTAGFKSHHSQFEEHISRKDRRDPISMVHDLASYQNFQGGTITPTGNPLDLALVGNGFFKVRTPGGEDMFTRNGRFMIDAQDRLVTSSGELVLNQGGQPIVVPEGETDLKFTQDGVVVGRQGEIDQLSISSFTEPQTLEAVGNNLFRSSAQPVLDVQSRVQQGYIEGSNVNSIIEMTEMMKVQRSYQSVARMLQNDHDRQRDAISKLSRTN
jgi:flagellar basal-body rod protein FlgF